jgi:hypothetical protein
VRGDPPVRLLTAPTSHTAYKDAGVVRSEEALNREGKLIVEWAQAGVSCEDTSAGLVSAE